MILQVVLSVFYITPKFVFIFYIYVNNVSITNATNKFDKAVFFVTIIVYEIMGMLTPGLLVDFFFHPKRVISKSKLFINMTKFFVLVHLFVC